MSTATVALGDLTEILSGFAFKSNQFGDTGDLPVVRIRDVTRGRSETYYSGEYNERFLVADGDVLIGMDGEFNRARWNGGPALLNQRVCRIEAVDPRLDDDYLFHFLPSALKAIERDTPFVTVKHLSAKKIREIEIPLPPIEEQRRIAAMLDAADALRAKRGQALAKLDSLTQSIFIDMFGDPVVNPCGWPVVPIGQCLASATYGTSKKAGSSGEFPVLRMGNVTYEGEIDMSDLKYVDLDEKEQQKHLAHAGDVLFNRTNSAELVGKTAVYRGSSPVAYAGYLVRLRTSSTLHPEYLGTFMNLPTTKTLLESMCKSIVGMANINAKEVQRIEMPLPPKEAQDRFADARAQIADQRSSLVGHLDSLDTLFASLQQLAFRGDL